MGIKTTDNIHLPRTRTVSSRSSYQKPPSKSHTSHIILGIIALACLSVIATLIIAVVCNPKRLTEQKITALAKDYYENFFYPQITNGKSDTATKETLERYADTGFANVSLRQLLLFDSGRHAAEAHSLTKYCDTNATKVRFYPKPPYGPRNYHAEFVFSCEYAHADT